MVNAADCKFVLRQWRFESSQPQVKGRSIIGNAFDLGSKITGSSPAALT
jgi:hypothetical protein